MSASVISAVNLAGVNVTRRRVTGTTATSASTSSTSGNFLKGGLPSLPVYSGKASFALLAVRSPARTGVRAQMNNEDPRNSPIARMAAGIEEPRCAVPTKKQFNVSDLVTGVLSTIWNVRKGIAGIAFAMVLALADAAPAMAGRGGGRSGGRMGGSSFRPSASRSMVRELLVGVSARS